MADLMRDHIGLGEIARHVESVLQLLVERQVDIDLLVVGAIERPHGRRARAAGRANAAGIEHQLRVLVALAVALEDIGPHVLGVAKHDGDELLEVVLLRRLRALDLLAGLGWIWLRGRAGARLGQMDVGEVGIVAGGCAAGQDGARVDAEEKCQAKQDQKADQPDAAASATAAARKADAAAGEGKAPAPLGPPVLDILALSLTTPSHLMSPRGADTAADAHLASPRSLCMGRGGAQGLAPAKAAGRPDVARLGPYQDHQCNLRPGPQMLVVKREIDKESSKNCHTLQACFLRSVCHQSGR